MAKALIVLGVVFVFLGLTILYCPSAVRWFGSLPGDIKYRGENTTVFIPVTSMIVISILLTLLIRVLGKGRF